MRTLAEVKENITADFMGNESAAAHYGFQAGDAFADHFRQTSVENIIFSVFAFAIWVLESMFDAHKTEVAQALEQMRPHRPVWYRNKALAFMKGKTLIPDTDTYDTADMSDAEIEAAHVIKHAVAVENEDVSVLTMKIAGEVGGIRGKIDEETERQFKAYMEYIRDAMVKIDLINAEPDIFNCNVDIFYDAMLTPEDVKASCEQAIKSYIENLPFNGEYTNMALVDKLQVLDGVKLVNFKSASSSSAVSEVVSDINARYIPYAGYFKAGNLTLNMQAYE